MPFLRRQHLDTMHSEENGAVCINCLDGFQSSSAASTPSSNDSLELDATDLLKHLPDKISTKAMSLLRFRQIVHGRDVIPINLAALVDEKFTKSKLPQQVAELNGLAIPAMLECKV